MLRYYPSVAKFEASSLGIFRGLSVNSGFMSGEARWGLRHHVGGLERLKLPGKDRWGVALVPVPQTDTGGLVEYTKAFEKGWAKELGKKAGRNLWEKPCLSRALLCKAWFQVAANVCQPTVYQKHSSLQTRIGDV